MPKTIREVVVAYKRAAPLYDLMNQVYFFGRDKRFRSMLVERLNLNPDDAVLDLCCGTGLDFPFLLKKIKIRGTLLVRSDAALLPFRDETFDAILVSFCLKITPAYEKTIEEAARVLKPAGRIGILANNKPSGPLRLPGIILTKVLSAMAKIDFEVNLEEHLSKKFTNIEDRKMHGDLVRFLVGEKSSDNFRTTNLEHL